MEMQTIPGTEGGSGSSRMQELDAPLLAHVLSYALGEALEHWRGQTADCLLCPMAEGEAIPMITAAEAAMRGHCRLVCHHWCRVLGGPFIRHCGFRSRELPVTAPKQHHEAEAEAGAEESAAAPAAKPPTTVDRAFGPWNGPRLFSGARSVTMAVSLSMLALDAWHEELGQLAPHAVGGKGSPKAQGQQQEGGEVVAVRLNVERTGQESHGEWEAVLRRMAGMGAAAGRHNNRRERQHEAQEQGPATDEEGDSSGTEEGEGMLMEGADSDEEAGAVFGPPPQGGVGAGMMLFAPPTVEVVDQMLEQLHEEEELVAPLVVPQPAPQHQHHNNHNHPNNNVVGGQQDGGIMGGLGGAVFGAGIGDAQLEAEEEALDAITSHPLGLRRPQPMALPRPPPPRPGFVLREVSLAHLSSQDAGGRRAPHAFFLKDDMVYSLLRHLPPTLERLSLARNPHLYMPLAPLAVEPILPNLKAVFLDGCWRVCVWHLRVLEAARPPPRFFLDLLHEDFGNGRGLGAGGRPCGMKEVVILNGRYRGEWVKCFIIHKAGPLRYHIKVLPTTKFDSAVGFSGRPALDVSRRHLRHHCSRKEEAATP